MVILALANITTFTQTLSKNVSKTLNPRNDLPSACWQLGLHDSCKNVNHDFSPWELRSRFSYTILIFFQTKFISTSDCLETTWVSSWGSGLSIWIKIDLWKQGLLFLEPIKIKDRSGRMWDFESFYYVIQNQIVFKLLECHPGVVECQSELKLFCGSRELYF